ncbi:HNH endonuclease [Neisseria perflava]|uniref:HNH endonuclease n=1 Tax=Neisseria perflava TaxID=33053 RepID=UPI0020A12F3B|nr:HNH endonuclease signature motif containing protein [Neisseria perflava]MCP1660139.1 hypothetical protein [Neisseria perflava]
MNFLIQTLVEHPLGKLSKEEILALMLVNITSYPKGFLNIDELSKYQQQAVELGFIKRKYNQIDYLWNLLKKLDNLTIVQNEVCFTEDAERVFGNYIEISSRKRDPYLHRLYKNQLQEESEEYFNGVKCMLEQLSYPVLIASHIKPFVDSNDQEAYDPNNGLLLSRTIDSLFDLKYISFNDDGTMLKSNQLATDVWNYWKNFKLPKEVLNPQRLEYLKYHRSLIDSSS